MSFLKNLFGKTQKNNKTVYNFHFEEIGTISSTRFDIALGVKVYELDMKNENLKLSFPTEQFFVCEDGKVCLMPLWLFNLRVFCSKIKDLKVQYQKIKSVKDALTNEKYVEQLFTILKVCVNQSKKLIKPLPKLEEYLMKLENEKGDLILETSSLMATRLLNSGKSVSSKEKPITKKEYSLKIIKLRKKYTELSRLIKFVTELFEKTQINIEFVNSVIAKWKNPEAKEVKKFIKQTKKTSYRLKRISSIIKNVIK
jgi:hypothetical protein